jgi:hypothetical protein
MSHEPFRRTLRRLDDEPPVFFADEVDRHLSPIRDRLVGLGLLRETTPATCVPCRHCGNGHVARVEFARSSRTGRTHAYLPCPECGPVEVRPDHLKRWTVDAAALVAVLARAAGIAGTAQEVLAGRLWRVGKASWGGRPREAYFARHVHEGCRPAVQAELARRPKALVFVPTEEAARRWGDGTPNPIIALEAVLSLGTEGPEFDTSYVEARLFDAGLLDAPARKPPRKRAERAGKIEALVREIAEHLRAARDHAFTTRDTLGTPELLPRPSQQDLAKRAGLTETDVSRCLKDPAARELRLLWETALELDKVLGWKGRPHR